MPAIPVMIRIHRRQRQQPDRRDLTLRIPQTCGPRAAAALAALIWALFPGRPATAGGFEIEQRLLLQNDGSIEAHYVYRLPESAVPLLASFQTVLECWRQGKKPGPDTPRNSTPWFMNRQLVERYFSEAGCRLIGFDVASVEGVVEIRISVTGKDAVRAVNSGVFGNLELEPVDDSGSEWVLRSPVLAPEHAGGKPLRSRTLRILRPPLDLRLSIITPGRIVDTTADERSEQGASWSFRLSRNTGRRNSAPLPPLPTVRLRFRAPAAWASSSRPEPADR